MFSLFNSDIVIRKILVQLHGWILATHSVKIWFFLFEFLCIHLIR